MGELVQQSSGEAFRVEDLGPLVEGQIGGHHDGAPLVALAEDLEERPESIVMAPTLLRIGGNPNCTLAQAAPSRRPGKPDPQGVHRGGGN